MMALIHIEGTDARVTAVRDEDAPWFHWRNMHIARLRLARSTDQDSPEQFHLRERFVDSSRRRETTWHRPIA